MATRKGFTAAQAAAAREHGKQSPAAILNAFFPDGKTMGEIEIRPVNLAKFMALEKIGSPFADFSDTRATSAEDIARAVVILSLPTETEQGLAELRRLASKPELLSDVAWALANRIPLPDLLQIGKAISSRITEGFATVLPTKAPGETGDSPFPESQPEGLPSAGH